MAQQIYVWDKFVRFFHWALVALFTTSYVTGENEHWIHIYSGYSIVTLIILRVVWGFRGSKHARFSDFVRNPFAIVRYLQRIAAGNPKRYLGHNPAGGAMVMMLLATLTTTTFSGMKLLAIDEGKGPFAANYNASFISQAMADDDHFEDHNEHEMDKVKYDEDREDKDGVEYKSSAENQHEANEELWEEIHEASISLMLLLIVLHVIGVIVASRQHKESLVAAMITGFKRK